MMNKIKHQQVKDVNSIPNILDYIICATGYESRCVYAYEQLSDKKIKNKICIGFNDNIVLARELNDVFFKKNEFEISALDGSSYADIYSFLSGKIILNRLQTEFNIVVDYSSMTKVWYAGVLNFFRNLKIEGVKIHLYFIYSNSHFILPSIESPYNAYVEPIAGFSNLSIPERPTALIIGLGYERNRAFSLKEYLDAEIIYLFLTDNSSNKEYYDAVVIENSEIISNTASENIFYYPLNDLVYAEMTLNNLCESLLTKYRIVLAPCGPKPFTLISLLVSASNHDVDVWRISAGSSNPPIDKKPIGELLISHIELSHYNLV